MIYGEHIRLRHVERADLPRFVEWLNDPEVRQGLAIYLPISQVEEENWFENMLKSPADQQPLCIELKNGENWELIGNCGLFGIDWRIRAAEFGIFIGAKRYWNQGYGSEAVRLVVDHGFSTLNLNRIFLRVYENNPRAIRAYQKAGLTIEGRQRQGHYQKGQYVDVLFMSILRQEWQE